MKSSFYNLIWRRGDNVLNLPVGLATSVKSDSESDTLMCDCGKTPEKKGQKILHQQYVCSECDKVFSSIGMIKGRWNWRNNIVYDTESKRQFLETVLDREIEVKAEVPLSDLVESHVELLNAFNPLEIYSNDNTKFKQAVAQIWKFLHVKKVALLVEAKYHGDNFMGYIIATTTGKVVLSKLNDEKNIKSPYSVSGMPISYSELGFVSVRSEREQQFIEAVKSGKQLEIPKQKVEVVPIISEGFFND